MNKDLIKVNFLQSTGEDEYITETMWCRKSGDSYILDNIPCVAKNISLGDAISVEYDEGEEKFYFEDFIAYSGNSTLRLIIEDDQFRKEVRKVFEDSFKCACEVLAQMNTLAINIPKDQNYRLIKEYVNVGSSDGKWQYVESCLSDEHRTQLA
ncbi:DUF4265 domain-containing protein [Chitinophaga ginsengisoli]|uniref:Uncharacterized protein DUF4265 n=1 Tax=Chitinophaga ginsengisoli TaxID=363837 RepID=A0A2P8FDU4_9BACT|nr:DUF4265 domain-containing protein [Chitinophaga ginsengisoli]PSL19889.1 uncharacterized protein DUF4265 [Chitinophaga ginsengisoli]